MSESKRAAVVKRGGDRDHRDMFASRPADLGSVKQTLRPPPGGEPGVAARNETSLLFTVDALRDAARLKTPEPEMAPLSRAYLGSEDEGVIDLNALASTPPRAGVRSVAPLFSEHPPGAFAADVGGAGPDRGPAPGKSRFRKRVLAGLAAAAVALVLCSVGLAAAFKGEEPVFHAAAAMAPITPAAPIVAPVVAPTPPPEPAATVAAASSSSDDDDSAPTKGKGKKGKKGKGKKGRAAKGGKTSGEALVSKPAAAPKAVDKCGCKGDFDCTLRCAAKGS